jgi:predicted CopG family antitoxin
MTTKNISITEGAYKALLRERKKGESFTEAILRLTEKTGSLSDCFGSWRMTDEEETGFSRELVAGWKQTQERDVTEVS